MRTRIIGIALATLVLIVPAYADTIFATGNHPQPGEENILFHADQTGTTIDAFTNQSGTTVQFSSTTDTLVGKGGQSDVDAMDGLINDISLTVPGHTFLDAIINPFKPGSAEDLMITVVTNMGTLTFGYGDTHGNNFLTIMTTKGQTISSVTIDSASGFEDLKQPRISGISDVIAPEPSSMLLLGGGLLGTAVALRRKRV